MCGVFGISFKKGLVSPGRRAVLSYKLADLNDDRGGHSWGIIGIEGDEKLVIRGMGDLADNAGELADFEIYAAHTRFATTGNKTIENAHPFKFGRITGMHNGMIYNHQFIGDKYNRKFAVDSMHLFAHLDEGRSFKDLEGYGSILWTDEANPGTVYACRMKGGELAIYGLGTIDNLAGIVISSDEDHLEEALEVAGFTDYFPYNIETESVYAITNGEIFVTGKELKLSEAARKYIPWQSVGNDRFKDIEEAFLEGDSKWKADENAWGWPEDKKIIDMTNEAWNDYCLKWENEDRLTPEEQEELDQRIRYGG